MKSNTLKNDILYWASLLKEDRAKALTVTEAVDKKAMIARAFSYLDALINGKSAKMLKDEDVVLDINNLLDWAMVENIYTHDPHNDR